jgi:hypothetical protein
MSALWHIAVLEKGPDWVSIEVRQAHPDAGEFPETRGFALRLLHERAWDLDPKFNYRARAPLGAACDNKQVADEDWIDANAARFIAGVTVEGTAAILDEQAAVKQVATQLGIKDLDQLPDDARERFDDAYAALWKDPARMPARRYRIQVTDPSFVSHLAAGDKWPSAAY